MSILTITTAMAASDRSNKKEIKSTISDLANAIKAEHDKIRAAYDKHDPKSKREMDLTDLGNIVGIGVMLAISRREGKLSDFVDGFKRGASLVTDKKIDIDLSTKTQNKTPTRNNDGILSIPPKPEMKDYYDSSDPRGCSMSEYNEWQKDLKRWEELYNKKLTR